MLYTKNETTKQDILNVRLRDGLEEIQILSDRATKTAYVMSVVTFVLTWIVSIVIEHWSTHKMSLKRSAQKISLLKT